MWDSHTVDELEIEFEETLNNDDAEFFIKYVDNKPIGFAQCSLRVDYVEGTDSSPVGYLEGIFVDVNYRNKGYAKELLHACEKWAKDMGCKEFASDCELDNIDSFKFHMAMGFDEANRIICFRKCI
jgi:aminoglycoside 6'-N-acetyltransferase I